jgi:hypothetical protein
MAAKPIEKVTQSSNCAVLGRRDRYERIDRPRPPPACQAVVLPRRRRTYNSVYR